MTSQNTTTDQPLVVEGQLVYGPVAPTRDITLPSGHKVGAVRKLLSGRWWASSIYGGGCSGHVSEEAAEAYVWSEHNERTARRKAAAERAAARRSRRR